MRKGEHGSLVVYADKFTKEGTDDKGAAVEIEIPFMKGYTVFNAEQIDGLPGHFYASVPPLNTAINRLDTVESFFANTKASIQHGGNRAFSPPTATSCRCRNCKASATEKATTSPLPMR